jgi:hypothetical protein
MARPPYRAADDLRDVDACAATDQPGNAPREQRETKRSLVLGMLRRQDGTSLAAIADATGWQAHTVRAALTGLRKQGHAVERTFVDGESRYCIAAVVTQ